MLMASCSIIREGGKAGKRGRGRKGRGGAAHKTWLHPAKEIMLMASSLQGEE